VRSRGPDRSSLAGLTGLAGSAGLSIALLSTGGLYLLATLCPLIFPVWRQLDQPGLASLEREPPRQRAQPPVAGA
jgi:hypothetical protein